MTGGLRDSLTHPDGFVILGRNSELIALNRMLVELASGQGGKVLLTGDAGIGKTTLVRWLMAEAPFKNICMLAGACYEQDVQAPYALWRDVLRRGSFSESVQIQQYSSVEALRREVLQELLRRAGDDPLMLVLEDIHWADQPSLDLLRYLIHQTEANRMLLIVTCREEEQLPDVPIYRFLPQFVREARPLRLGLRPLGRVAIGQLLDLRYPGIDPADRDRILDFLVHYGEGNPFFVDELLGMLDYERVVQADASGWVLGELPMFPVPPLVRQIIDSRLLRLEPEALDQLERAAILGVELPLDDWTAMADVPSEVMTRVIDEALDAQILSQLADDSGYRFRHALIRSVLYDRPNTMRRRTLHRRAGEVLAGRRDVDPAIVAHHFSLAQDERAADWLILAGRAAARSFALQDAAENYRRALDILERGGNKTPDRVWLLCALAEAHRYTRSALSLDYVNRAFDLLESLDDPAMRVLAISCRARIRGFLHENVIDDLLQASREYDLLSSDEKQRILETPLGYVVSQATLAQDLANYGQYDASRRVATAFLDEHEHDSAGATPIEFGNALFGLGMALASLGQPAPARDAFRRSRAYFQEIDNYQMLSVSLYWELSFVAQVYDTETPAIRRRLRQAEVDSNRRSELARAAGTSELISTSETMILDGEWEYCRRIAEARLSVPASQIPSIRKLVHLDWLQGYPDRATELIGRAFPDGPDEAPGKRMFLHRHEIQWIAAEIALDRHELDLAERWIAALEYWSDWSGKITGRYLSRLLRSRLAELSGDPQSALEHAESALELARSPREPLGIIAAQRAIAGLLVRTGHQGRAASAVAEALDIARTCEAPYEVAATLLVQAEMLHASGLSGDAASVLSEARDIAQQLGAGLLLKRIDSLSSARPVPEHLPEFFGLSPREMQVLHYVAQGYTDARIAEALSISPRTVGGHLQSILNKTGTNSRTAATALAYEHGVFGV